MKYLFYKIFCRFRALKKLKRQLDKTNQEIDAKVRRLELTDEMLHEKQEEFMRISYLIHEEKEKLADVQETCHDEEKKLDDIVCRYKVMYSDYKKIYEDLDRYKRRTVGIANKKVNLDIPYADVKKWMQRSFTHDPETGNRTTILELCYNALRKENTEKVQEEAAAWGELQAGVRETGKRIEKAIPEAI